MRVLNQQVEMGHPSFDGFEQSAYWFWERGYEVTHFQYSELERSDFDELLTQHADSTVVRAGVGTVLLALRRAGREAPTVVDLPNDLRTYAARRVWESTPGQFRSEAVNSNFDLAVWSSSSPDYAAAIASVVLPAGLDLKFVWGRDRCVQRFDGEQQAVYYVKDLRKVERQGYDLNQILIADDTPQKCARNYGNAVYVRPFLGDPNDTELERLAGYLKSLASCKNVRSIEKRNWRLHYDAGGSSKQTGFFEHD